MIIDLAVTISMDIKEKQSNLTCFVVLIKIACPVTKAAEIRCKVLHHIKGDRN